MHIQDHILTSQQAIASKKQRLTSSHIETISSAERLLTRSISTMVSNGFGWRGWKPVANLDPLQNPREAHFTKSPGSDVLIHEPVDFPLPRSPNCDKTDAAENCLSTKEEACGSFLNRCHIIAIFLLEEVEI